MWTWIRPQTSLYEDTGTVEYQLLQSRVLPASLIHLPTHLCNLAVFWSYLAIICWDILGHPDVREFEAPNLQCHLSLSFQCAGQKAHERQKWWWEFSFRPKRCIIWCFFLPLKNSEGFIHMTILQPQARRPLAQSHDVGSSGQVPQHDQWPQEWNRRMEGNNCLPCLWSNGQWLHVT